jgi:hypothetical protein
MIVPFLYKPGILRDGTIFQDEYCTDGQWIRFVGGKIKKMKGQQEVVHNDLFTPILDNIIHLNVEYHGGYQIYYANTTTIQKGTLSNDYDINNTFNLLNQNGNAADTTWQSVRFIRNTLPCIAFLKTQNGTNMSNEVAGSLYWKQLNDNNPFVNSVVAGEGGNICSGGILYSNPCLYLYGNNGTITRSKTNDPLDFNGGDSGMYNISADKLIFGANVRGGSNAPSLLFWTANSVIYLTNVADGNAPVDFQKEVITNNSSLMSSRSIVQYDSLFFWLGTDRIFNYNGIVDSIPNTINLEYFFDNVDLNKRQKIYGYKIARYGEVRWAYPEKAYANNPNIGCTREIVYNVRENSWYDCAIQRDCITVFETTGDIFSYGDSCTNYPLDLGASYKRIWKHETGVVEVRDGLNVNIPSFFVTPFYGFVTFNPAKTGSAIDKYIWLNQIEPDFPSSIPRTNADEIVVTVSYKKYAGSAFVNSLPFTFKLAEVDNLGKIDMRVQGRFMNIKISCAFPYDVGTILLNFKEGDGQ